MTVLYHKCEKGKRCRKYRDCKICNNIRKAQMSDLTELAGRFSRYSQYAVVMPHQQVTDHIKALKTNITRTLRKSANGALITVETSKNDALHLNIILNTDKQLNTHDFTKAVELTNGTANVFIDDLNTQIEIRNATSYGLKIESIPPKYQWAGNTVNTTGNLRTMREIMQGKRMLHHAPHITMTSLNNTFADLGLEPLTETLYNSNYIQKSMKQLLAYGEELKRMGKCYSTTHGLMTLKEFQTKFNRKLGAVKRQETKRQQQMVRDRFYS